SESPVPRAFAFANGITHLSSGHVLCLLFVFLYFSNHLRSYMMVRFSDRMILLINRRCKYILFLIGLLQWQFSKHLCLQYLGKLVSTAMPEYMLFFSSLLALKVRHIFNNTENFMFRFNRHLTCTRCDECCCRMWRRYNDFFTSRKEFVHVHCNVACTRRQVKQ